jgi:hypothetical protein
LQEKRFQTDSRKDSTQRRLYFPPVDIHLGVAALLAVCLQLLAIFGPFGSEDLPRRVLFVASYLVLLTFVAVNRRRPGIVILGVGLACNFLVIVTNGGFMPTTARAYGTNDPIPEDVNPGDWIPHSKDVLLDRADVHLYVLSDHLVVKNQQIIRVFSVGDILIAAGILVTAAELLTPRIKPKFE